MNKQDLLKMNKKALVRLIYDNVSKDGNPRKDLVELLTKKQLIDVYLERSNDITGWSNGKRSMLYDYIHYHRTGKTFMDYEYDEY